jgi:hypothetical protein
MIGLGAMAGAASEVREQAEMIKLVKGGAAQEGRTG